MHTSGKHMRTRTIISLDTLLDIFARRWSALSGGVRAENAARVPVQIGNESIGPRREACNAGGNERVGARNAGGN